MDTIFFKLVFSYFYEMKRNKVTFCYMNDLIVFYFDNFEEISRKNYSKGKTLNLT